MTLRCLSVGIDYTEARIILDTIQSRNCSDNVTESYYVMSLSLRVGEINCPLIIRRLSTVPCINVPILFSNKLITNIVHYYQLM